MYLTQQFDRFVDEWAENRRERERIRSIDPYRIIRDLGVETDGSDRSAFWITLYRYRSLGLTSRRVRVRPAMKKRNDQVYRILMYWAHRYDPMVVPILERFLYGWNFALAEQNGALFFMIRRTVLQGLDLLVRYQETGRAATRSIAEDKLRYARVLTGPYRTDPAFAALAATIDWLLREASREPLRICF